MVTVDLSRYDNAWYDPGRGFAMRALWHGANVALLRNPLNTSSWSRAALLRLFGARVGRGTNLKPGLNVKHPWNLEIGDHSWIGENVWLDTLAPIRIGAHVCVSQGAYFCTGNHDWSDTAFGLRLGAIRIEDGAWIGARAVVLPGVVIATHSVLCAGAVLARDTEPFTIYAGNPAVAVRKRVIRDTMLDARCSMLDSDKTDLSVFVGVEHQASSIEHRVPEARDGSEWIGAGA